MLHRAQITSSRQEQDGKGHHGSGRIRRQTLAHHLSGTSADRIRDHVSDLHAHQARINENKEQGQKEDTAQSPADHITDRSSGGILVPAQSYDPPRRRHLFGIYLPRDRSSRQRYQYHLPLLDDREPGRAGIALPCGTRDILRGHAFREGSKGKARVLPVQVSYGRIDGDGRCDGSVPADART